LRLAEADVRVGCEDHVRRTGEGEIALPGAKAFARDVHRNESRRAGRVDREGWPLDSEVKRHPAGEGVVRVADAEVGVHVDEITAVDDPLAVVAHGDADERTGVAAHQVLRVTGALEDFPSDLEQHPLLWIHHHRFARRNPEEISCELFDVVDESRAAVVHLAGRCRDRIVDRVEVPTLGRDLGDRIPSLAEDVPELIRCVGAAGESTPHADDRDRFALAELRLLDLRSKALDRGEGSLQLCFRVGCVASFGHDSSGAS